MLTELETAIPDAYVGEDGTIYILFSVEAGQFENGFLANQLVLNDMFVQTASMQALRQRGAEHGLSLKEGTRSIGTVIFSGDAATYIPVDSEVAYDPGSGLEILYFTTTTDGTIPAPGLPTAPAVAINATAGNLNGLYEYVVTFVTTGGEGLPSSVSVGINPVNQQANLTAIPIGGAGTTKRRIYRSKNGVGIYRMVTEIANNTATTYTDNIADAVVAVNSLAPTIDAGRQVTVSAEAVNPGSNGNVVIGSVTVISRAPASLTDVINPVAFTGGSDSEDTESYRQRLLQFMQNPQTGSASDIQAWSENIAGVESATVFANDNMGTPTNGHVTVRVTGPGGTVPGTPVTDAVLAALIAQGLADITYHVSTFVADVQAVTVDVTTSGTYVLADVTPSVQDAITTYINGLAVGETLFISGIIAVVKPLAGILDVTVTSPATNQTTVATHKKTAGTVTVT
jgi:uncharacterized phage protein gp47/JayE